MIKNIMSFIDRLFMERIEADDILPIGVGQTLLVETSYFSAPMRVHDKLEAIKSKGYTTLLAHPERYNYMDSFTHYSRLKEMGFKFQLNLMSLSGHYGPAVRDKTLRLLSEGYIDRLGSDLHRYEHRDIIRNTRLNNKVLTLLAVI